MQAVTITAQDDGSFTVAAQDAAASGQPPQPVASIDEALEMARQMLSGGGEEDAAAQIMSGYSKGAPPAAPARPTPGAVFGG